jgi:hypothetical protein
MLMRVWDIPRIRVMKKPGGESLETEGRDGYAIGRKAATPFNGRGISPEKIDVINPWTKYFR